MLLRPFSAAFFKYGWKLFCEIRAHRAQDKSVVSVVTGLSKDEEAVYRLLNGRLLPVSEVSRLSGFGKTKCQGLLGRLVKGGYARKEGNGRGTKYGRNYTRE